MVVGIPYSMTYAVHNTEYTFEIMRKIYDILEHIYATLYAHSVCMLYGAYASILKMKFKYFFPVLIVYTYCPSSLREQILKNKKKRNLQIIHSKLPNVYIG